LLINITNLVT